MKISRSKLNKIKKLVNSKYAQFAITIVGANSFTKPELTTMSQDGVDISNKYSIIDALYLHHFINTGSTEKAPTSLKDMIKQQVALKVNPNTEITTKLNDDMKDYIDKISSDVFFRVNGVIKNSEDQNSMFNLVSDASSKTVTQLKQELKDTSGAANRDWERVALTEISNTVGLGSVDKIVDEHEGDISDVYVYRLTVTDNVTCQWCKKFYGQDKPKVYRLSTLMANGSNYGKNRNNWAPVVGSPHPNSRTSPVIELKPGFILGNDRNPTFVGNEAQKEWLKNNVNS